ncbi:aminotransferase class I/II-fold pyridoxal phosphate-dependent enzyme [Blastococcus montanus]|uniref:aminotransferase class I/II-fold pyridoxal phosphate-dependent enzyme n=1 Tax=Blastococcus montanus TaxID=3144973 RepID=UPI003208EF8A
MTQESVTRSTDGFVRSDTTGVQRSEQQRLMRSAGAAHGGLFEDLAVADLRQRRGVKWAKVEADVLPAWIADMDYPVAPPIREALVAALDRGDLGYPGWSNWMGPDPLAAAFTARMRQRYGWDAEPTHVRTLSDILQGLQIVLHVATSPGDAVVVQTPNYPPFLKLIEAMGRRLVSVPFERHAQGWGFDPDRLEEAVVRSGARVLFVVNPHNPTGRVLTGEELAAISAIGERRDLLLVADEVLADLTLHPHQHIPLASLGAETARRTVTLFSATKAFNIAGLRAAVLHAGDPTVRTRLRAYPPDLFGVVDDLAVTATRAAWAEGDGWLGGLLSHLAERRDHLVARLAAEAPQVQVASPQSGYMAWLDCRGATGGRRPAAFFREEARVELSPGETFGRGGAGFVRLNFATSSALLDHILDRMVAASRAAGQLSAAAPAASSQRRSSGRDQTLAVTSASTPDPGCPTPEATPVAARTDSPPNVWAAVDYHPIAVRDVIVSELLVRAAGVRAGQAVLDVGSGSGNTAIAAARRGALVTASDVVPAALAVASRRAQAEGLDIRTEVADAEQLPFPTGAFDVVVSSFGAMYAPDHQRAADELLRVCRPGGSIAMTNWTPGGIVARLQRILQCVVGPPPKPGPSGPPVLWGTEQHCYELFGEHIRDIRMEFRVHEWCAPSAEAQVDLLAQHLAPWHVATGRLDDAQRDAIRRLAVEEFERSNASADGSNVAPAEYLELVITRS